MGRRRRWLARWLSLLLVRERILGVRVGVGERRRRLVLIALCLVVVVVMMAQAIRRRRRRSKHLLVALRTLDRNFHLRTNVNTPLETHPPSRRHRPLKLVRVSIRIEIRNILLMRVVLVVRSDRLHRRRRWLKRHRREAVLAGLLR